MSKTKKAEAPEHTKTTLYAVAGSFAPTDFRFYQGDAGEVERRIAAGDGIASLRKLPAVVVRTHQGYVGTNASPLKEGDEKNETELANRRSTNPGARDVASLDADKDTLVVIGAIKFVANYFEPERSDSAAMAAYQRNVVEKFMADGHYPTLIRRYLLNLVNGTALWRNRYGFMRKTIISLRVPGQPTAHFSMNDEHAPDFERLVAAMAAATQSKGAYVQLEIALIVELGFDAEVYPSQPFISGPAKLELRKIPSDNNYGRLLATRRDANNEDQVILTSNKVGNALRRVDLGYTSNPDTPIAVELFGTVATERVAHRLDQGTDYFSLVKAKTYETMSEEDRFFMMSVFVKGGLLGFPKDDAKKSKKDASAESTEA